MASFRPFAVFCAVSYLAICATADSVTCQTLEATTSIPIDHPLDLAYTTENSEYWCAFFPSCVLLFEFMC